jgi:multiple sugar transport system permease protein
VAGPLSILVSLCAAMMLHSKLLRFKAIFRLTYFIPVVTTLVAVAIVWRFIYHPKYGILNYFLGLFGVNPIDWLGNPDWAMPAIILLAVWKNFGYNMIIFIAGLENIPQHLYEAAVMEGANRWQQFKTITLPLLAPTTLFVSIITMIGFFQLFAEPYIMTQGGPLNRTLSIVQYMYREGFRWWNIGYSAAIAFILFIIIFCGTLIQFKLQKKAEYSWY